MIENVLKMYVNVTFTIQKTRDSSVAYSKSVICGRQKKNRNFERPKTLNLSLDYSNQGGCCMTVFLKGCNFEHTKLSMNF